MKKLFKKSLAVIIVVVMALTATPLSGFVGLDLPSLFDFKAEAAIYYYYEDGFEFIYNSYGNYGVIITDYYNEEDWGDKSAVTEITVPATLGGTHVESVNELNNYPNLVSVTFSNGIKHIGGVASCEKLTSVTIPDSVTDIGSYFGCISLTDINIPNSVTTIRGGAFANCDSLTSIDIPDSVTTIGGGAFYNCKSLTSINIPDSVTTIGKQTSIGGAFENCDSLTSVNISNSVTTIYAETFYDCDSLTSIDIPNSVTTIQGSAFAKCDSLTSINIPSSVTTIGSRAFADCDSLTSVPVIDGLKECGGRLFADCDGLTSITIPNIEMCYGGGTFANCDNLVNVNFSDRVNVIASELFYDCDSLKTITIPDSIVGIYDEAFYDCDSLTSVIIQPNQLNEFLFGDNVFGNCNNLEYVHMPSDMTYSNIGLSKPAYICSTKEDCCAKTCADAEGIEFRVCDGHGSDIPNDEPTDTPTDKSYKVHGRDFEHNLDYFTQNTDSSKYDPELANMLAALSAAAYDEDSIKQAYEELGFDDCETFNYDGFTLGKVAYSLAFKKSDNSDETICLVTVRGTVNASEWFGNANISTTNDKHDGFLNATNQIYDNIQNHIDSNNITGDVKYFVTGHSRGAAVGNLLSVGLMENGVTSSDVYNYNYACPDVATKAVFPDYYNIFNVCNTADVVPFVPGNIGSATESESHWGKYGRTRWFTMDIPDTGNILQDMKNDHNVDLYLRYMDEQLDPSKWYRAPANNSVIGHNAKILCPVDVVITNKNGKTIASVINGEINYYDSAFGDVIILTDGDKKFIYINGDKDFIVNLVGTDNGEMTYSIEKYNIFTEETLESKTFENVKLEKGKEMQSSVCGDKTADDVSLYVYENNDGEKTAKYLVNTDGSEIGIGEAFKNFAIKQPSVTTINYGDTLVLNADTCGYTLPSGYTVKWFVEGAGVSTNISEDGLECRVTSVASGNVTIYAKLVDADENVVANVEGTEICDEITITSKAGFWQKFISFFKNLFRINRIIY